MEYLKEIWKDVLGYEKLYKASNLGRFRSLDRYTEHKVVGRLFVKGRILKLPKDKDGYSLVNLTKNKTQKTFRVSILIYKIFKGNIPPKMQVDHIIEGDKSNNNINNLQLLNSRQNIHKSNKNKSFSSKYIGVSFDKNINKWVARIFINGRNKKLGYFNSEIDASEKYNTELNILNNENKKM